MKKYKDTINEATASDVIDKSIVILQKGFDPKGKFAKEMETMGTGYSSNFKKLDALMSEVDRMWLDLYSEYLIYK